MSRPKPIDKELYEKVKQMASEKFETPTSWYRSAWIVKTYKKLGGRYDTPKTKEVEKQGLIRWANEQWVNLNAPIYDTQGKLIGYEPCGRKEASLKGTYPLCRPLKRITEDTPITYRELTKEQIQQANRKKQVIKSSGNIRFGGYIIL